MTPWFLNLLVSLVLFGGTLIVVLFVAWLVILLGKIGWWPTLFFMINYRPQIAVSQTLIWAVLLYMAVNILALLSGLPISASSTLGLMAILGFLPLVAIPAINR